MMASSLVQPYDPAWAEWFVTLLAFVRPENPRQLCGTRALARFGRDDG